MILLAEDRKKKTIKLNTRIESFVPIQRFRDAASAVSYFFRTMEVPRRRLSRLHLQLPHHLRPTGHEPVSGADAAQDPGGLEVWGGSVYVIVRNETGSDYFVEDREWDQETAQQDISIKTRPRPR